MKKLVKKIVTIWTTGEKGFGEVVAMNSVAAKIVDLLLADGRCELYSNGLPKEVRVGLAQQLQDLLCEVEIVLEDMITSVDLYLGTRVDAMTSSTRERTREAMVNGLVTTTVFRDQINWIILALVL